MFKPPDSSASDTALGASAGADLIEDAPEIGAWLKEVLAKLDAAPTVGMYTYLDSDAHVRVSLACDAIMRHVVDDAKAGALAYIQTPSICYDVPAEANAAAKGVA